MSSVSKCNPSPSILSSLDPSCVVAITQFELAGDRQKSVFVCSVENSAYDRRLNLVERKEADLMTYFPMISPTVLDPVFLANSPPGCTDRFEFPACRQ